MGEHLCVALIPFIVISEALVVALVNCFDHCPRKRHCEFQEIQHLAEGSPFNVNELEALYELFKKLSCSIIDGGLIHKTFADADADMMVGLTKMNGKILLFETPPF